MSKLMNITKFNVFLIIILPISLLAGSLINNLNVILIVIFFLLDCRVRNNFHIFKEKSFLFLFLIWLYLIFNSLYVGETSDSIIRSLGYIRFFIFAYAIHFYLNIQEQFYQKKIFKYWAFLFLIVSIDLTFEAIFGKNIMGNVSTYPARLVSFTGDELKIGGFYFGFIALALAFFYDYNKKLFLLFFIIFFILSLLIGERANFIKIFLMYLMFIFFIFEIKFYKKILIFLVFLITTSSIVMSVPGFKSKFYNHIFNVNNMDSSDKITLNNLKVEKLIKNKHFAHYYTAINIFKENPIFGVGLKEFRFESRDKKYSPIRGSYGFGLHPHQVHFEILSELGIVGYFLIISNLFYIIFNFLKNNRNHANNIYIKFSAIFIIASFIPLIPSGSFFTTYGATIYWINYSLLIVTSIKNKYA
ncbi:O-antigen ligase family protein [Candidatus Pelagibacter sp.]|nr:O-antigen ligase family protein [Candidatus Pelagibacter sp.]